MADRFGDGQTNVDTSDSQQITPAMFEDVVSCLKMQSSGEKQSKQKEKVGLFHSQLENTCLFWEQWVHM